MNMDKCWMDMAIRQGHTIIYIGCRLAPIESVIFKGMEFRFQSKFVLELCLVESLETYNVKDLQNQKKSIIVQ